MVIPIKYNEEQDEFFYDLTLQMRLENYINAHFPLAYFISKMCPIYLLGGGIRDLIYARTPKDLDFVVLGKENLGFILEVFEKFDIQYGFNKFGGFKFKYNDTVVDLWASDDLLTSIQYNIDGLFFDLRSNSLISLTFDDFINNGLKLIDKDTKEDNGRCRKLIKFAEEFKKDIE